MGDQFALEKLSLSYLKNVKQLHNLLLLFIIDREAGR